MEKPVILSDIPAHREIIKDSECGIFVSSIKPKELANKIVYTYKNRDKLLLWGSYGRTITKTKYSWDKVTEDLEQFIIKTSNTNI